MSAVLEAPAQAPDQSALLASVDDVLRNMPVAQLLGRPNGCARMASCRPLFRFIGAGLG